MNTYQASAPGSVMLAGEHAVLHGYPALVAALDKRLQVKLTVREDTCINIHAAFGDFSTDLTQLMPVAPYQFVLMAIKLWHEKNPLPVGFDLEISSEFSHQMGLGSSAAISVAVIAVLAKWQQPNATKRDIFHLCYAVIKAVQGVGSGADVAASVFGGVNFYQLTPSITIDPLPVTLPLVLIYCGSKMPTREVVAKVEQQRLAQPAYYEQIFSQLGYCVEMACEASLAQNWHKLGHIFNRHQQLQADMQLSMPVIDDIIISLLSCAEIYGAKISGSGLGDGVIGIGSLPVNFFPATALQQQAGVQQVPVILSTEGIA